MPVIVAGAVLTLLAMGAILVRVGASDGTSPSAEADPSTEDAGIENEPGARPELESDRDALVGSGPAEAALAHAAAGQQWLYLSDAELESAVRAATTPDAGDRLAREVVAEVGLARERLERSSGRVWWLVRPLAWQVDHERNDSARVSVWVVTVLSAVDIAAPQTEFTTLTIDLERIDGAWLVADVIEQPGPTPATGPMDQPWDAVPFDDALDGFTRVGGEPVR